MALGKVILTTNKTATNQRDWLRDEWGICLVSAYPILNLDIPHIWV